MEQCRIYFWTRPSLNWQTTQAWNTRTTPRLAALYRSFKDQCNIWCWLLMWVIKLLSKKCPCLVFVQYMSRECLIYVQSLTLSTFCLDNVFHCPLFVQKRSSCPKNVIGLSSTIQVFVLSLSYFFSFPHMTNSRRSLEFIFLFPPPGNPAVGQKLDKLWTVITDFPSIPWRGQNLDNVLI